MTAPAPPIAPPAGTRRAAPRAAVLRSEARLHLREPANILIILFPPVLLAILGAIPSFREVNDDLGGLRVIDLYVPVVVLAALISTGLQVLPPALTSYRELGILRRMSTTPVRPSALLAAQVWLNGLAALLSAALSLAVGRIVLDVALPGQFVGYVLTVLLAAVACLSLGALVAARARTAKHATGIGTAAFFPAMFSAGLWLPVQSMPDVLATIVRCTPFGAAASALDQAAAGDWPSWSYLGVLAVWSVLVSAAAVRWFRWE